MANIKDGLPYDPFPKTGLIKQYEPLIRDTVAKFCKRYPQVNREHALAEAVRLAQKAADNFDPSRGTKFGTPLILYLRALPKMFEEETGWSHSDPSLEIGKAEPSPAAIYPAGANGTRLLFDLWEFAGDDRKGAVLGIRLNDRSEGYARGVAARFSEALKALAAHSINDDVVLGRMRAAIDHMERREREAQQEEEDRARGVHSPAFLDVRPLAISMQRYKARTPRQNPRWANIRNSENEHDPRGAWEEGWRLSLGGILHQKASRGQLKARMSGAQVELMREGVDRAIALLRPSLKKNEAVVMDGLVTELDNHPFPVTQLAAACGMQERGIYKIRERLMRRIGERLTAIEEKNENKF